MKSEAKQRILVVGAGFAGAVHARELADAGHPVVVIDRRDHIAGNAFDEVKNGVRVHRYGPHLFHTSNPDVIEWISRFTDWIPYIHKVKAKLSDGRLVPFPPNRETVASTLRVSIPDEETCKLVLSELAVDHLKISTARELLESRIGSQLTEMFFGRYTKKMWGHSLDSISQNVLKRVPIRLDEEDRYFPADTFQALPRDGYTTMVQKILSHPNILVNTSTDFDANLLNDFDYTFNSMAIDEFFNFKYGPLPYRSIKFHHHVTETDQSSGAAVINYTDEGLFTRETHWHNLPTGRIKNERFIMTVEEPCSYESNNFERYYPIKTEDGRNDAIYQKYVSDAGTIADRVAFIGRCGTYQYLDMHQVINQSLMSVRRWISTH